MLLRRKRLPAELKFKLFMQIKQKLLLLVSIHCLIILESTEKSIWESDNVKIISGAAGLALIGLCVLGCYLHYLRKLGERMSKVETLAGAKELEILQKQLDQPNMKPNFDQDDNEGDVQDMIMSNN